MVACQGTFPAILFILKIKDPELAWKVYLRLQKEGMDIMGTAAVIAYASRLGLVELGSEGILRLIDEIVNCEGPGNVLAEGIKKASEHFGVPAVYVKGGMESWSSDVRPFVGSALIAAVADSGSVNRALYGFPEFYYYIKKEQAEMMATRFVGDVEAAYPWSYSESKVRFAVLWENLHIIADSLGVCVIALLTTPLKLWAKAYEAVTGEKITEGELMTVAERTRTLERLFTLKHGDGKDDLSPRLFKGEPKLDREELEEMKRVYYSLRGWDENGVPTPETVEKLGLGDLV
jgi:aldehyde:ferredoxin oxidoreductase